MKTMTTNMNGYCHTLTNRSFNERLLLTFERNANDLPDVWAMQEVPTGGKNRACIRKLKELGNQYGYDVVLPSENVWDYSRHPKSILNALLLKGVKKIELLPLENIELHSRYNYVKVVFADMPEEVYIINIHAPQTDYFPGRSDSYIRWRQHLAEKYYEVLFEEIRKLIAAGKRVIIMGDFNRTNDEVHDLLQLGLEDVSDTCDKKYESIDHILISANVGKVLNCTFDREFATSQKLSNHHAMIADIAF